ncbi:MAG: AAA family ATPase [Vampirovibrio sp.]
MISTAPISSAPVSSNVSKSSSQKSPPQKDPKDLKGLEKSSTNTSTPSALAPVVSAPKTNLAPSVTTKAPLTSLPTGNAVGATPLKVEIVPSIKKSTLQEQLLAGLRVALWMGVIVVLMNPSLSTPLIDRIGRLFGRKKSLSSRFQIITNSKTRFKDVIGADAAKEEVMKVLDFLKNPKKYTDLGARPPMGMVLHGPPGTGKTLLAKAIAGEGGAAFISVNGSEFVNKWVGQGAANVRNLGATAKALAEKGPVVVFIDEIDAVGRNRKEWKSDQGGDSEHIQTLNQLLSLFDGIQEKEAKHPIIFVGATNHKEVLDPALRRRLEIEVGVNPPPLKGRRDLLEHFGSKVALDDAAKAYLSKTLALNTYGMTGADISNLINQAAILAGRQNSKTITPKMLEEAFDFIHMGTLNTSVKISPADKITSARHEAGHAVVGHLLEPDKKVTKINITPRGEAGGVTWYSYSEKYDPFIWTQKELQSRIASFLGGRLAEASASTGAASDFKQVSNLVEKMVKEYGMFSPRSNLALMNYSNFETLSEAQKQALEYEMQVIVNQQSKIAQAIIKKQARLVEAVTEELLKNEVINGDRFLELVQAHGKS